MVVKNKNSVYEIKAEFSEIIKTVQFWRSDLDTSQGHMWELLLMQSSRSKLFPVFHCVANGAVVVQQCPDVP